MPGVPAELAEHKLHVNPGAKPVKQGLRRLNEERRKIVGKEVARLLAAALSWRFSIPSGWLTRYLC